MSLAGVPGIQIDGKIDRWRDIETEKNKQEWGGRRKAERTPAQEAG